MPGLPDWIPERQEKSGDILQKLLAAPAHPFAEIRNWDDVSEEPGLYAISLGVTCTFKDEEFRFASEH